MRPGWRFLGCAVLDEPFYAYWLKATKREEDPGYAATLAAHEIARLARLWKVEALLLGPVPGGKAVWYQKHMAIHMLPEVHFRIQEALRSGTLALMDGEGAELFFDSRSRRSCDLYG